APGEYTIYAGDGEGCYRTATATLENEGFVVVTDASATGTSCGDANGVITITATSENATFVEYSLNGIDYDLENMFSGLPSGKQLVYARDSFGCIATAEVEVPGSTPLSAEVEISAPICADGNGEIRVVPTGGVGPYQYSINGGSFRDDAVFDRLDVGEYTIEVRDASGCFYEMTQLLDRDCVAALPTAIAPNGNGKNECFQLLYWTYVDIKNYQIFHRWGELVYDARPFNSVEHTVYWDGKVNGQVDPGVFLYNVTFVNEKGEEITMQGNVTVIQ
ncbi:MAG: gliding motility-associated C-terminal domain-containing protein, partial [Saprospiraceae bacterium]|nr:gliding motility-associated C-terminal domain-containing protein [Saprospiraceae bacterium]